MPLPDHFHPPLSATRHGESFHASWATGIMASLNRGVLPPGYFAEAQVHIGGRVEIDVASFEDQGEKSAAEPDESSGGVAVARWAPPAAALVIPAVFPDEIEVQVVSTATGATLVAAIELISPGNKDRPEPRRAFAARCAGYLQMGIGLAIVNIVAGRHSNLHDELMHLLGQPETLRSGEESALDSVAYRPVRRDHAGDLIEIWPVSLNVGQALPIIPLSLRGASIVPLELEASYAEARQRSRL
jgi:hypothetical protein